MGKRIIQQARGKGSLSYQARKRAYQHTISYPDSEGEAEIVKLIHSAGHSAPLIQLSISSKNFFIPAFNGAIVGEKISIGGKEEKSGNILCLRDISPGMQVY